MNKKYAMQGQVIKCNGCNREWTDVDCLPLPTFLSNKLEKNIAKRMTKQLPQKKNDEPLYFRLLINICICGEPFFALFSQDEVGGGPGYEDYIFFIGQDGDKPETFSEGYVTWEERYGDRDDLD